MAATIELKYYNSFWLKKIKDIVDVTSGSSPTFSSQSGSTIYIASPGLTNEQMNVGQEVIIEHGLIGRYVGYITKEIVILRL